MKRVLIVKMSSMGDVLHTLPALTDAKKAIPDILFDWVVEPSFKEIPQWHPAVGDLILAPMRRWRKTPWQCFKSGEWKTFVQKLRQTSYDAVIDAQGLVKSAIITKFAKGKCFGPHYRCARETLAGFTYQHPLKLAKVTEQHAVARMRHLFAAALGYSFSDMPIDYGIDKTKLGNVSFGDHCIMLLHGTTWVTKHWPESYWQELGYMAAKAGYKVLIPWGNDHERLRANNIQKFMMSKGLAENVQVLPKLTISDITSLIAKVKGIVAVDTGLGHVAAAMSTPTVSLYGPTDPLLTGAHGQSQCHLRADFSCAPCLGRTCKKGNQFAITPPCFETLPPLKVWQALVNIMSQDSAKASC